MQINFLRYKKIYFTFSGILILASLISLFIFGLNLGIDFTGGSILEIEYQKERPSSEIIRENLADMDLGTYYLQPTLRKAKATYKTIENKAKIVKTFVFSFSS